MDTSEEEPEAALEEVPIREDGANDIIAAKTIYLEETGDDGKIIYSYQCLECDKNIKTSRSTNSNIKRHLEVVHGIKLFKPQKEDLDINKRLVNLVVGSNLPLSIINDQVFRDFVYFRERNQMIKSTQTLKAAIMHDYDRNVEKLKKLFEGVAAIAITADAWSANNKSFLGVSAAWYDPQLKRQATVLAIRRNAGSMGFERIGDQLVKIFQLYEIREKIVSITTDNGSNFCKCMLIYGTSTEDSEPLDDIEIEEIKDEDMDSSDSIQVPFPKHIRCAAHKLNLVAKSAEKKIEEPEFKRVYDQTMLKCRKLWNSQCRSTKNCDEIRGICDSLFIEPVPTRWNSMVDALKDIMKKKKKLKRVTEALKLELFTDIDLKLISDYLKVMNPVAQAIDILQGDDCPYGLLFLTIDLVKKKIFHQKVEFITQNNRLMEALASLVQTEVELRFDKISFAEHIAAALSPRCLREEESLKDFALSHIDFIRGKCQEITAPEDSDEESDWDSPFFSKKPKTHDCGIAEFMASGTTHEDLLKSKCLTRLFKTYNTPLATSASIERAFSQARRTLTFQRSRLGDRLFNAIAVLRATKPLNL